MYTFSKLEIFPIINEAPTNILMSSYEGIQHLGFETGSEFKPQASLNLQALWFWEDSQTFPSVGFYICEMETVIPSPFGCLTNGKYSKHLGGCLV